MTEFSSIIKPLIFSFYAEKGGVGKTTTCITLAYYLARNGKKVLIYDCDPQRSLTGWIFGNTIENDFDGDVNAFIYNTQNKRYSNYPKTLYEQMLERDLRSAEAKIDLNNPNLMIVPGDNKINFLDLDIHSDESSNRIGIGITNRVNEVTGKPYHAIKKTADEYQVDFVFLDLNPYNGVLNRCLLMSSNYLIMPSVPDFFSFEMMNNMITILKRWNREIEDKRESTKEGRYPFPEHKPKYLGYIVSRYHPLKKGTFLNGIVEDIVSQKDVKWFRKLESQSNHLVKELRDMNLSVKEETYRKAERPSTLGLIREYRSLKSASDQIHIPVPFLTSGSIRGRTYDDGTFLTLTNEDISRIEEFHSIIKEITQNIFRIIHQDQLS